MALATHDNDDIHCLVTWKKIEFRVGCAVTFWPRPPCLQPCHSRRQPVWAPLCKWVRRSQWHSCYFGGGGRKKRSPFDSASPTRGRFPGRSRIQYYLVKCSNTDRRLLRQSLYHKTQISCYSKLFTQTARNTLYSERKDLFVAWIKGSHFCNNPQIK